MERLIGCCGFKCYMCAAYEGNIHSEEERKAVCDKWKYYFDYEVSLEKMHCNGCRAQDNDAAAMIHGDCQYRSCVMDKGLENWPWMQQSILVKNCQLIMAHIRRFMRV